MDIGPVQTRAITNNIVLSEAYEYAKPSSFSGGVCIDLNGPVILLISGTPASMSMAPPIMA